VQVVEVRAPAQQFAEQQWRPALGKDFGTLGHRAKLTVPAHRFLAEVASPIVQGSTWYQALCASASPDYALARRDAGSQIAAHRPIAVCLQLKETRRITND
jgi:hypothetical protein